MGLIGPSWERRYRAAFVIYMAAYTHKQLSDSEQSRVDQRVHADMSGPLQGFSPFEFERLWPLSLKSAWRAYAMAELDIPPAIEGLTWRLPKSGRLLWGFKTGPGKLYSAYRFYDSATLQAKHDLESKGLNLQGIDLSARQKGDRRDDHKL